MKLHQIFYLIREGLRNAWQNRLMALASVGVLVCCLTLTGFAYLIYVNVEQMFQTAYEQNVMAVYLESDTTDDQVEQIGAQLQGMSNVKDVSFLSKEEFLAQYGEVLEAETLESFEGEDNPMPDTYMVTMKDLALFDSTLTDIQALPGVEEVSYDADTAEALTRVRGVVLALGGGIIAVLLLVSLFIIVNTIKLTVHNRRLEIYIMKSVGATDGYVRFPFIVEGLVLGGLAGSIGYGLLALLYSAALDGLVFENPLLQLVPFSHQWGILLTGFLLGGMLVGVCGSAISMGKYLHQEGSARI